MTNISYQIDPGLITYYTGLLRIKLNEITRSLRINILLMLALMRYITSQRILIRELIQYIELNKDRGGRCGTLTGT